MKKFGKVILILVIILIIATIGFGGWYFFKREKESNEKTGNLENQIVEMQKADKETDNIKNTVNNTTAENATVENKKTNNSTDKEEKTFTKEDLKIKSFYLGDSIKGAEQALGSESIVTEDLGISDATGKSIYLCDFKNYCMKVWNVHKNNEDSDGSMDKIELYGNSKLETARGIKIGSSREDVLKAYPSDCILKSEELDGNKIISVGVTGSDPVCRSSEIGTIHFEIENGKVVSITLAYSVAE